MCCSLLFTAVWWLPLFELRKWLMLTIKSALLGANIYHEESTTVSLRMQILWFVSVVWRVNLKNKKHDYLVQVPVAMWSHLELARKVPVTVYFLVLLVIKKTVIFVRNCCHDQTRKVFGPISILDASNYKIDDCWFGIFDVADITNYSRDYIRLKLMENGLFSSIKLFLLVRYFKSYFWYYKNKAALKSSIMWITFEISH